MTTKLTRREFLVAAATATVGALLGGIVRAEEPAAAEDIQAVPLEYTQSCTESDGKWDHLFSEEPALYPSYAAHVSFMCDPSRVRIDEPLPNWAEMTSDWWTRSRHCGQRRE